MSPVLILHSVISCSKMRHFYESCFSSHIEKICQTLDCKRKSTRHKFGEKKVNIHFIRHYILIHEKHNVYWPKYALYYQPKNLKLKVEWL